MASIRQTRRLLAAIAIAGVALLITPLAAVAEWEHGYHTDYDFSKDRYTSDYGWHWDADEDWFEDTTAWDDSFSLHDPHYPYTHEYHDQHGWEWDFDVWDGWERESDATWFDDWA